MSWNYTFFNKVSICNSVKGMTFTEAQYTQQVSCLRNCEITHSKYILSQV